ncbi:diphthine synthase [Candidatus Bathyarchaeota archaeon]|nr:diphthine synthase [Candidatus Bathyarchaeota archaeon]
MKELVFIGLGLFDQKDISLRGFEILREADTVFAEMYTSLMPGFSIQKLEKMIGKTIIILSRKDLEEEEGKKLLIAAKMGKTAFLVQGDPLIATTHVDLLINAKKRGIKTRIIHGASVVSAVRGISGLQNYKFGKAVTIPFSEKGSSSETPYNVIGANKKMGLHTMCYLDIKAEEKKYLTIDKALKSLIELEKIKKEKIVTAKTLVIGIARAGSTKPIVKADYLENLISYDFGSPPHTLVFPGKLHFMETEALVSLAGAPKEIMETSI